MSTYIIETEPAIDALVDADSFVAHDVSTFSTRNVTAAQVREYASTGIVSLASAAVTITQIAHAGRKLILNRAAGVTATLPAATGTGAVYLFIVGTTVTSNADIIQVASASDVMAGTASALQDAADTIVGFETVAASDTITLNGTTTGGILGGSVEVVDIATGVFWVRAIGAATGTEVTPFSAAVS